MHTGGSFFAVGSVVSLFRCIPTMRGFSMVLAITTTYATMPTVKL